jgi:hypothetical protein
MRKTEALHRLDLLDNNYKLHKEDIGEELDIDEEVTMPKELREKDPVDKR